MTPILRQAHITLGVVLLAVPATAFAPFAAPADAGSLRLAGVLLASEAVLASTHDADAWCYPVGCPHGLGEADSGDAEAPYRLLRTVSRDAHGRLLHQGADIGNQRSGGVVRAAAAGLVLQAARDRSGYGEHVV